MLDSLIREHYERYLRSSNTCKSDRALRDYLLSLEMFCREAGEDILQRVKEYRDFHWIIEALAERTVWPDGRSKKPWKPRMIYKVATECICFFRWALAFKFTSQKIALDDQRSGHLFKKAADSQPEFFEWDSPEFRALYHHPNNTVRDLAVIEVLRASGMRAGEASHLLIQDANLEDRLFEIKKGKGGKSRFAPMDEQCAKFLNGYVESLKVLGYAPGDCLFPNFFKSKKRYTEHSIWKMLHERGKSLGIRAYPHKLRHTLAGELLDRGADLLVISEAFGHKDLQTTRRYTHLRAKRMLKLYDQTLKQTA